VIDHRAHVTCHRRWPDPQETDEAPPYLVSVENTATHSREFSTTDDSYIAIWFKSPRRDLTAAHVFPRIGPYGAHPVFVQSTGGDGWHLNAKLPPGLPPGWHAVTLRTAHSPWANSVRIGLDLSPGERLARPAAAPSHLHIAIVTDGKTWERNLVHTGVQSAISLWVSGLPENAAAGDVTIWLSENDLPAIFLSEPDPQGLRQINAMLPAGAPPASYTVSVSAGGSASENVSVKLV